MSCLLFSLLHFVRHSDVAFEENCCDFVIIGYKAYQTFKLLGCGVVRGFSVYFDMAVLVISIDYRLNIKGAYAAVQTLGNCIVRLGDIAVNDFYRREFAHFVKL